MLIAIRSSHRTGEALVMSHRDVVSSRDVTYVALTPRHVEPETSTEVVEEQAIIDAAKKGTPLSNLSYVPAIGKFVRKFNVRPKKKFNTYDGKVIKLTVSTDKRILERQAFE